MKKLLFAVAIATLFISSCQVEFTTPEEINPGERLSFRASIEDLSVPTKGTLNASNQLVWAENDKIGIYFPDWGDKNQPFKLNDEDAGKTSGNFTIATEANPSGASATAAFYPWNASGKFPDTDIENNVYNGVVYFKLKDWYDGYTSGKMLTPLVAPITSSTDPISFKHAGAAVELTINNLVSGTYKAKMTVDGKQITGGFHVNPANAGTEALAIDAVEENTSLDHITLNTWKSSGAFSWIFPVPELTTPSLSFEIKDDNGVVAFSASSNKSLPSIGRGQIYVLPALSVTAYKQFSANATWGVCGTHNSWSGDTKMVTDGSLCIAKSIEFAANAEFKVRTVGDWGTAGVHNFGWSNVNSVKSNNVVDGGEPDHNIKITTAGTYDVIFNSSGSAYGDYGAHEIRVVSSKYPYPLPKETASITIDGTFTDWDGVTSESAGNTTVKVVSDNTKVSLYVKITGAASDIWDNGGGKYVYALFDLDGDPSNDVDQWGKKGDFVLLLYPYAAGPAIVTSSASSATTWICKPNTPYTVANISLAGTFTEADGSGNRDITYEFSIPRADMPTIPSTDPITITITGSKISSNVSISRKL